MSIDAMKAVRDADIRPSGRKFVALALADYADENWSCFPHIETLAKYTAQGEKTVRDHLDALEADGVISRDRIRRSDGTLAGYRYRISVRNEPAADFASGENRQRRKTSEPAADFAAHEPPRKEPPKVVYARTCEALASVIGDDLTAAFIAHRKAMKRPMTEHAGELLAKRLAQMRDPVSAVQRSIENGWQGIFEQEQPSAKASPTLDRIARAARRVAS